MTVYTKADLQYQVESDQELQDILAFLNDPRIPNTALKTDLLRQSPDDLIARDRAEMAENARHLSLGRMRFRFR